MNLELACIELFTWWELCARAQCLRHSLPNRAASSDCPFWLARFFDHRSSPWLTICTALLKAKRFFDLTDRRDSCASWNRYLDPWGSFCDKERSSFRIGPVSARTCWSRSKLESPPLLGLEKKRDSNVSSSSSPRRKVTYHSKRAAMTLPKVQLSAS